MTSSRNTLVLILIAVAAVAFSFWIGFSAGISRHKETRTVARASQDTSATVTFWTCSMHPQVMQGKPGVCPICNMKLVPVRREAAPVGAQPAPAGSQRVNPAAAGGKERKIAYYWDPMMNPPYISKKPGKSPMGMDLVPVYEDDLRSGPTVTIDPAVTQNIGIRVARAAEGPLRDVIRAVGYFRAAEPDQYDITLKVGGYIERLYANTAGALVEKDAPLFDLYSPDLLIAEEELLAAKRALDALPPNADAVIRAQSQSLFDSVRRKLELWSVPDKEIDALLASGTTNRTVTFRSPAAGFIIEKNVTAGASVNAGESLLRIADLSTLWLDAQIFEDQLPYVSVGQKAAAAVEGMAQESFSGQVIFIDPRVNPETRTATARLSFRNPGFILKPGMFANVEFAVELSAKAVQVPREAMIDTGKRQIVFIAHAGGRFEPRFVKVGAETADGMIEILTGLAPGDTVVTSGQFLLDTESRTREAIEKMTRENLLKAPKKSAASNEPGPAEPSTKLKPHSH